MAFKEATKEVAKQEDSIGLLLDSYYQTQDNGNLESVTP